MRHDVDAVWNPMQLQMIQDQKTIDAEALKLYEKSPKKAMIFLDSYSNEQGTKVMDEAIKLGDFLWTKYDEKF
jgi:hypothetical protein